MKFKLSHLNRATNTRAPNVYFCPTYQPKTVEALGWVLVCLRWYNRYTERCSQGNCACIKVRAVLTNGPTGHCPFPWGIGTPTYYIVAWAHPSRLVPLASSYDDQKCLRSCFGLFRLLHSIRRGYYTRSGPAVTAIEYECVFSITRRRTAWHCQHLLLTAVLVGAVAAGWPSLSIDISCPPGPQQQTAARCCIGRQTVQTDGQTDGHRTVT